MLQIYEDSKIFMNTAIKIKVVSDLGTVTCRNLISDAFEQFNDVVKKFSRFDPNSELSKLNRNQEKDFKVSEELFFLINKGIDAANLSDGSFDPTIIDILEAYGYDAKKDFSRLDDVIKVNKEIEHIIKTRHSYKDIVMDKKNLTIRLQKNQRIDLGGVGKGYAIDLAANVLKKTKNFIINAGGDTYAKGFDENNVKWSIGLTIPNNTDTIFGKVELDGYSLACSGSWANRIKFFHHLINPKSGRPDNTSDLAFVYTKDAIDSDVYATLLYLKGEEGLKILEKQKMGGLLVKSNEIISNSFFPNYI